MPDPANLPLEIFAKILDEIIVHPAPDFSDLPTNVAYTNTAQQLHSSNLVSRKWYACSVPKLYSHWRYDGSKQGIVGLWKFYCTVRSNQSLAMLVRSVCIQQCDPTRLGDLGTFSEDEDVLLDGVFNSDRRLFRDIMPPRLLASPLVDHFGPLMAVLMTYLPNLTNLHVIEDHLDRCLVSLMLDSERAESGIRPTRATFQHLKEASFHTRTSVYSAKTLDFGYPMEDLWPVYSLPRIESLTIAGFIPNAPSFHHDSIVCARTSSVTNLTLNYCASSGISYDMARTMLTLPLTLTKLSLYYDDFGRYKSGIMTNPELWKILVTYQDSLQHLNVYREPKGGDFGFHNVGNDHMGLLSGFRQLETLSIQSETLLGRCRGTDKAPFHLKDTLPPSLKTLTFYDLEEDTGIHTRTATQLTEVVRDKCHAFLRSITITQSSWVPKPNAHTQALGQACQEANVELRIYQGYIKPSKLMACFPALQETGLLRRQYEGRSKIDSCPRV